ncbi:MAG TPA: PaaI family thioesterase [Pyrinomonadaceae bacterium]|nr:PaaI family thioesterase [Pyrinomonadaceae bacterium]
MKPSLLFSGELITKNKIPCTDVNPSVPHMKPTNPSFAANVEDSFALQPIMKLIGARLLLVEPGVVEITLPYRADLLQQNGYLHAGIITTIADSACGYAAYTLMPAGSNVLSVEFKLNLLRPAQGETFVARAEVIKAGRTLTVVRADVFALTGDNKVLVATMQGTMIRTGTGPTSGDH